jgi:hypothetical protein
VVEERQEGKKELTNQNQPPPNHTKQIQTNKQTNKQTRRVSTRQAEIM